MRREVLLVDLEVERRRVIEDEVDVDVEQVRHAEVDGLLDGRLVRLEDIHRPVQMVEIEPGPVREEHLALQPLLPTRELGGGPQTAVGHHGEERALEPLPRRAAAQVFGQHGRDAQLLPQRLKDVDAAVRPAIEQAEVQIGGRFGGRRRAFPDDARDAAGQALEHGAVERVGPAEVVDHLRDGAALGGVPDVLGELVVLDDGAVSVAPACGPQVHAYENRRLCLLCQY